MEVFYLHGFASSAGSSKAAFFAARLREHGLTLRTPDFNEPDFRALTITRMIDQVGRALDEAGSEPVVLIGSSLGGLVAVQAALQWPARVTKLVLLAPAVDLRAERMTELGDRTLAEWKSAGETVVFHYGYGRLMPVGYTLYEDARQYDTMTAPVEHPTLVFQGRHDASVSPQVVEQWASARPMVELQLLDDDHQLLGSLDRIWTAALAFLSLS